MPVCLQQTKLVVIYLQATEDLHANNVHADSEGVQRVYSDHHSHHPGVCRKFHVIIALW